MSKCGTDGVLKKHRICRRMEGVRQAERVAHSSQNKSGVRSLRVKPENRVKGISYLERKGDVEV